MAKSDIEVKVKNEYIQRLEGEDNSLFILKLSRPISIENSKWLHEKLECEIQRQYPGSRLLMLPDYVESIRHFDESDMNKAGWFSREDLEKEGIVVPSVD